MKQQKQLPKSRWLVLTLLSLLMTLGGTTSAWADAYTNGFETSEGWTMVSAYDNALSAVGTNWDYSGTLSKYQLSTSRKKSGSYGLYCSSSNSANYIITPKLAAGTISFWASANTSKSYKAAFYTCTKDGDTYTISSTPTYIRQSTGWDNLTSTMTQYSFELAADSYIAILLSNQAGIDDFSASNGLASTETPAKAVGITGFVTTTPALNANSSNQYEASFTVTVANQGSEAIAAGDNVTVSLLDADDNPLATSAAIEIAQGGTQDVILNYTGTSTIDQDVTFKAKDNFSDKIYATTATVSVTAYGARFSINTTNNTTQNLGAAAIGGTLEKTFTITNSGNAALTVTFEPTDVTIPNYVVFSDALKWGNANVHYWGGSTSTSWPGVAMTEIGTNEFGEKQFKAVIPTDATGIIFNNGNGAQTVDIAHTNGTGGYYTINEQEGGKYKAGSWNNGPNWNVDAGNTRDFTVALNTATAGVKEGNVVLNYTDINGASTFTIPVTGYVLDDTKMLVDFSGNTLPDGWTNSTNDGAAWTFADGVAYGQYANYKNAKMTSPLLTVAEGEKLYFQTKGNTTYADMKVNVFDKNWNKLNTVDFSTEARAAYTAGEYTLVALTGLAAGNYRLEFEAYNSYIDNVNGFTVNMNDPKMGVYNDAECTDKIDATAVTKDFDFVTTDPTPATYYIKNDGTGTMELSKGAEVAGFTVTLDKTEVAAGEHATLTIAMPAANKGYHGGDIVVTATDLGTFTVSAQGVVIDEDKMDLDFATDEIPAAWAKNNWSRNPTNGYIETSGYGSTSLETINLTAAANEDLVIVAQQTSSSSSYKFGVNYKKVGVDDEWQELIPAANIGTTWTTLHAQLTEAGDYQLQFNGACTQVKRIYGLAEVNEPFMQVYDGENLAGASYAFTKVNDENPVNHEFTVKNVGKAKLTNLTATLSGTNAEDYAVAISGATGAGNNEIEADAQATVTVTQKAVIGTHSATLTIAADGFEKVIALSGETTDHTALNIDFSTAGVWPAEILEHEGWNVNWGTANQPATTAASMILTPLTVANASDVFSFKVKYYSSSQSSKRDLVINYTTDGGLTWNPYNWGTELEPVTSLKSQITSSLNNFEITNIPAGTVAFDFSGTYISVDDITGDMKVATAPLMTLNTVSDGISGANLKADGQAVYTLANKGNADYATTVTLDGVSAAISGEGVTYDGTNLTIPAGKTADITVTMTFEAPYGVKNGSVQLAKAGWVDAIALNYTATLVDPTDFVEDFSGNAKPAGWYSDGWTYTSGAASVVAGVEKPMITEKIGAVDGKNELKFNAWTTSDDPQTLKVYTSTDRKNWTQLGEDITLTKEEDALYSRTLTNGDQYIKFGGVIAKVDNITGVKKLDAPAHDLYEVTNDMVATSKVPGSSITVHVTGVSLRATEDDIIAELWVKKDDAGTMLDQQTGLEMTVNVNKEFTLTGNVPAVEGDYKMWVTVKKASDGSIHFNTDEVDLTIAHTKTMNITTFENAAGVQADDYNQYDGTFFVTVQNTGSTAIAANEVSVTLTDASDAENKFISTWTAENSDVLYMNTKKDATDIATDCTLKAWCWNTTEDGIWVAFSNINEGFWSLDLSGKTNFIICRVNPAGTNPDPWNNVWNKSGDLTLSDGNLVKFNGYSGDDLTFTAESMTELAPTMTTTLKVDVYGTLTAGDDASISFTAKEGVTSTYYAGGLTRSINVTAAPVIVIKESDGSITPAITGEFQNRKVEMQRYFNAKWNTICVPFAIADVEAAFGEGAKAFEFTSYAGGELQFHNVTALGTATPYILYLPNAIGVATTLAGLTVSDAAAGSETSGGATFQGTYAPIAAPDMNGLWGVTSAGKIAKGSNTASLKGFRAYFTGGDLAGAHIAIFDDATGITTVLDAKELFNDGKVYNLNGQRVENAHKGIFIVNGKKVVVK